jgi:hypothetical protein
VIETLSNPVKTAHLVVSLAEEMPLVESLELRSHLFRIFPNSQVALALNRLFPIPSASLGAAVDSRKPFAETALEHAGRKSALESENLAFWSGESFARFPYFPPPIEGAYAATVARLNEMIERGVEPHPVRDPNERTGRELRP